MARLNGNDSDADDSSDNNRSLWRLAKNPSPDSQRADDGMGGGVKLPQRREPTRYLGNPNPTLTGRLHMARTKGGSR